MVEDVATWLIPLIAILLAAAYALANFRPRVQRPSPQLDHVEQPTEQDFEAARHEIVQVLTHEDPSHSASELAELLNREFLD